MSENNLKLWEQVEKTDPGQTKKVSYGGTNGRSFTTINAQYQIMQATEIFGTYGEKFGVQSLDVEFMSLDKGQLLAYGKAVFFYDFNGTVSTFPISSSILVQAWNRTFKQLVIDDEFAKKLETDITTKALSKLGFAADVFLGRFDDNKYVNDLRAEFEAKAKADGITPPKKETTQKTTTPTRTPSKQTAPTQPKKPGAPKSTVKAPDLITAGKMDIAKIVQLTKNGQFDRALNGVKHWEEYGRAIEPADKKMIVDLVRALRNQNKK